MDTLILVLTVGIVATIIKLSNLTLPDYWEDEERFYIRNTPEAMDKWAQDILDRAEKSNASTSEHSAQK